MLKSPCSVALSCSAGSALFHVSCVRSIHSNNKAQEKVRRLTGAVTAELLILPSKSPVTFRRLGLML